MVHEGPDLEKTPRAGRESWALASWAAVGRCPCGFLSPYGFLPPGGVLPQGTSGERSVLPIPPMLPAPHRATKTLGGLMLVLTKVRTCLHSGPCPGGCTQPCGLVLCHAPAPFWPWGTNRLTWDRCWLQHNGWEKPHAEHSHKSSGNQLPPEKGF